MSLKSFLVVFLFIFSCGLVIFFKEIITDRLKYEISDSGGADILKQLEHAPDFYLDDVNATNVVIDARAPERYRGEVEPMDPVAGHIPGALNRPFSLNLRPDGRFKPGPVLRGEFEILLHGRDPALVIHQCGSGVTACHNLLAMALAGQSEGALYPGSWSEWCADASRPIASGEPAALEIPKRPRT